MAVSKELIDAVLSRASLLFDAPIEARNNWSDACDIWVRLLDGITEEQFSVAARRLARELTRFPVPADFIRVVNGQAEAEQGV